ncbi:MAG: hypothetical protein HY754_13675 [Nitrospirae bacterium]|nr:hypothetical protein [Nitrospirota bacterium]
MKSNYEKYIKETWDIKEATYKDFKKSGVKSYADFIKNELRGVKIKYRKKRKVAA